MNKVEVFQAIVNERRYQDEKFGVIDDTGGHTLGEWLLLIESELQEAKEALIKGGTGRDSFRAELVQIAALCMACLEQHGLVDPHERRQI